MTNLDRYGDPTWFVHDRFGLFLHWGLYSLGARHEWLQNIEKIPPDVYGARYKPRFDPDRYDASQWARDAKAAGMRYAVLTTKHHEGFCLWDSKLTDFKAPRDLVREYVDAFRAEGLKIGFYHSLIDWHHPGFSVDGIHPLRDELVARERPSDMDAYREYLHGQVRELLTNYGRIDYLFYDFSYPSLDFGWSKGKGAVDWNSEELEQLTLELQPHILVNDRLDLGRGIHTAEQYIPPGGPTKDGQPVVWEACHTLTWSWGYYRGQPPVGHIVEHDPSYKPVDMLVRNLVDIVSKGGNLLLNVGPTARGEFDPQSRAALAGIGEWMDRHERSIRGAGASAFTPPEDCRYTQNGNRLYLHLFAWPRHVWLPGLGGKVEYAQLLADASEVRMQSGSGGGHMSADVGAENLMLTLPPTPPHPVVPVIELFLKRD